MAEKVGKCVRKKRKKSATFPAQALSCSGSTGIISASPHSCRSSTGVSTPGTLITGFPPAIQRYVTFDSMTRQIKNNPCNIWPDLLVFNHPRNIKIIRNEKNYFHQFCDLIHACSFSQADDKNQQTRKVSGFHGVEVSGGIDLYLSSGPESVAVSASSVSVRDHMITEVIDGVLRIRMER